MKHEFNQNMIGMRLVPATPEGLAERIIAKAAMSAQHGTLLMMFVLPRPVLTMTVLLILSFFAGAGIDLGFNSYESLTMNEQDILYSFENSFYVETL